MMMRVLPFVVVPSLVLVGSAIPLNAVNFEGGLRLTVSGSPTSLQPQELLLDTGSSTLAFCDSSLATTLKDSKTDFLSCNLYGSGNEGYWGPFYNGSVDLGTDVQLKESYYSIMQQEVSMPCGSGLQGIFGVAFKQLDQAADHPGPLDWPAGSVGSCPPSSTTLVGPLMHYLKQDTSEGRLGIYWSGQTGTSQGELYVGSTAVSNPHYTQGSVLQAQLGELGYYDITIQRFLFGGESYPVSCNADDSPCLMDTGTPIMFVPQEVYQQMTGGQSGTLSVELASGTGSPVTLVFDAATLVQQQYVAPYQGGPYILGLPLWATYYTVFNVDKRVVDFVQHSSAELFALKSETSKESTIVV